MTWSEVYAFPHATKGTSTTTALAAEGKGQMERAGASNGNKSRTVTHHRATQQHDRQLDALIMPAGSRQRGRGPLCSITIIVSPAAWSELSIY